MFYGLYISQKLPAGMLGFAATSLWQFCIIHLGKISVYTEFIFTIAQGQNCRKYTLKHSLKYLKLVEAIWVPKAA